MNALCVNSVDNFCYRWGEIILTKKKWTVEYPNISSATRPPSPVKVCLFQKHPSFSLHCDEEEEMFLKKHCGHLLQEMQNFCSTYIEPQTELSDLIKDLKTLRNKAELLLSRLNSGVF